MLVNWDNFDAGDTIETASHFMSKDCKQALYDDQESQHSKVDGRRYELSTDILKQ